jgi:hypothetical protein
MHLAVNLMQKEGIQKLLIMSLTRKGIIQQHPAQLLMPKEIIQLRPDIRHTQRVIKQPLLARIAMQKDN